VDIQVEPLIRTKFNNTAKTFPWQRMSSVLFLYFFNTYASKLLKYFYNENFHL
jgi:hypothetical protein